MSVDKTQDLILNTQEFQQGQLPDCGEESEQEVVLKQKNQKNTTNKIDTKVVSKSKTRALEDDRTSSSSEGSESSASYVAVEFDADDSESQKPQVKPVFKKNDRGGSFAPRRSEFDSRGYISEERRISEEKIKPHYESPRNHPQQQNFYHSRSTQNAQYFAPHPNSFMYPQQSQFQSAPTFYSNHNNAYLNHSSQYPPQNSYYHHPQFPPTHQNHQNQYGYQNSNYNSFTSPNYPSQTFQQQPYNPPSQKISKNRLAYQHKTGVKTVINNILQGYPKKQQIVRLIFQLIVDNKNDLVMSRLGVYWSDKAMKLKIQKILKILQSNDLILKLNVQEQQIELQKKKDIVLSKRDPRLKD